MQNASGSPDSDKAIRLIFHLSVYDRRASPSAKRSFSVQFCNGIVLCVLSSQSVCAFAISAERIWTQNVSPRESRNWHFASFANFDIDQDRFMRDAAYDPPSGCSDVAVGCKGKPETLVCRRLHNSRRCW